MRVLAIDPGEKKIGLAISDPAGVLATPLAVLKHISRAEDANRIAQVASQNEVGLIVVGQALDAEGLPTLQSRRASRLAVALRLVCAIPVCLWDESSSTQAARAARIAMGSSPRNRGGHLDDIAATIILQDFLEQHRGDRS